MNKTVSPMQELIENLKRENEAHYTKWKKAKGADKVTWDTAMSLTTLHIMSATSLLQKEKEAIIDAVNDTADSIFAGEQYFNSKYKQ